MGNKNYGLTYPQKNIWLVEKFNGELPINSIVGTVEINMDFDSTLCIDAVNSVIKNNDALRIKFDFNKETLEQYVTEYKYKKFEVVDMSMYSQEKIEKYIIDFALQPLFFGKNCLFDFRILDYGHNKGAILMKIHHIICDAWSCSKIGSQLVDFIEKKSNNEEISDELKPSYFEFVNSEKEYEASDKYKKDEEFWREYLSGIKETTFIKSVNNNTTNANRYSIKLEESFNNDINMYCKDNKISPYVLFLAALSTYIYRIKNNNDLILGTPVLNRSNFREKNMVGMFVSTMPIRIKIEENIKFLDLAKQISLNTLTLFRHQKYPYSKTLEYVHKETDITGNLYNVVLSYQNARADLINKEKYSTTWPFVKHLNDELQIHIMDMDNTGVLNINYDYLVDAFSEEEVKYLHTRLIAIIKNAISDLDVNVENIRIMSPEEENKILYEFNDTKVDYPKDKTVIELFEEQVKKTPNNIAIVFEGKEITYKELNDKANKIANFLRIEKGIKSNDIVALIFKRSFEMIIAILGTLKSGAAYLPIDPDFPEERIKYMIEDSNSKVVLSNIEDKYINGINIEKISKLELDKYNNEDLHKTTKLDDLAYIIYTSGTTGKPKGVMISVGNLLHIRYSAINFEGLEECKVFGCFSTYSFDISILEIFIPLTLGAKIILANEDEQKIPDLMGTLLLNNKIEVLNMTPTRMKLLLEYQNKEAFSSLKKVMLGGEVFPSSLYEELKKYSSTDIYDGYGPTEITVWSSAKKIEDINNINIGKSLPNVKSYILDNKNRLLPLLIEGELCVGGDGVAKGYYNNKETTEAKFVKFNNQDVYKTGDLSKFEFNGDLQYLGRLDSQIKLNGLRIEIEEIENVIKKYPNILHSAVTVNNDKMYAYFIASKKIEVGKLKKFLSVNLPKYMIPKFFLQMDKFPLTVLGKIDKKSLPEINNSLRRKIKLPKTALERTIYIEIVKITGIKSISVDDNFFDIGLDSLNVIELVTRLGRNDVHVTYGDIFDHPTVQELAKFLELNETSVISQNDVTNYDYTNIQKLLSINKVENIPENIKIKHFNNVLLTGVTGFLGIHILENFLRYTKGKIYCIIRNKNNKTSEERLRERLEFFFGKKYNKQIGKRIIVIDKELNEFCTNKSNKKYAEEVANDIDLVIHSAARVKHFGDRGHFFEINVNGTKNITDFCVKYNKKLVFISTLSVSGNILEGGYIEQNKVAENTIYDETSFYINQNLNNIYAYTKFLAERYVLEQVNNGLNACIIRVGNLTSRFSDGKFQINVDENAFANRIKTVLNINTIPENLYEFYLEFSPVDYAAKAVLKLSEIDEKFNVYHLFNHNHILISDFINILWYNLGIKIRVITEKEFADLITKYMKDEKKSEDISGIVIDLTRDNRLNYKTNTKIKSDFTINLLKKIGFMWPEVDQEYLIKYFNYLKKIKFLKF